MDSFKKVLNAQDAGIVVIKANQKDETLSLPYSNTKIDQLFGIDLRNLDDQELKQIDPLNLPILEQVDF